MWDTRVHGYVLLVANLPFLDFMKINNWRKFDANDENKGIPNQLFLNVFNYLGYENTQKVHNISKQRIFRMDLFFKKTTLM